MSKMFHIDAHIKVMLLSILLMFALELNAQVEN